MTKSVRRRHVAMHLLCVVPLCFLFFVTFVFVVICHRDLEHVLFSQDHVVLARFSEEQAMKEIKKIDVDDIDMFCTVASPVYLRDIYCDLDECKRKMSEMRPIVAYMLFTACETPSINVKKYVDVDVEKYMDDIARMCQEHNGQYKIVYTLERTFETFIKKITDEQYIYQQTFTYFFHSMYIGIFEWIFVRIVYIPLWILGLNVLEDF